MDTKAYLAIAARAGLKTLALVFVGHGFMKDSGVEIFIAIGMIFLDHGYSMWKAYGSVMLKASLDLLRAKVLNAAARAQTNPGLAAPALASVAAHVQATEPPPGLAPVGSRPVAFAIAALILGTALLGPLQPGAAYAQTRPFKPTGDLIKDIQTTKQAGQATVNAGIDDLVSKLDKLALPDFEFALAQATASKNEVTIPCWQAWVDLIKARQAAALGADGQPLPLPDPHVITAIERISELLAILRPDSKISLSCVQIAATARQDVALFVTSMISGGALGLFKLPIPIGPIP